MLTVYGRCCVGEFPSIERGGALKVNGRPIYQRNPESVYRLNAVDNSSR